MTRAWLASVVATCAVLSACGSEPTAEVARQPDDPGPTATVTPQPDDGGPAGTADAQAQRQRELLDRNEATWAARHVSDYRFELRTRCFCPNGGETAAITVRDGRARGATGYEQQLDTIPELFELIRHTLDDPQAGEVSVRYDARTGVPLSASIDRIKMAIDDEIGWTVSDFQPIP